jgi:hypothetical protein
MIPDKPKFYGSHWMNWTSYATDRSNIFTFAAFPVGPSEANKRIKFERKKMCCRRESNPGPHVCVFHSTYWVILHLLFIVLYLDVGSSNCLQTAAHAQIEISLVHPVKLIVNTRSRDHQINVCNIAHSMLGTDYFSRSVNNGCVRDSMLKHCLVDRNLHIKCLHTS